MIWKWTYNLPRKDNFTVKSKQSNAINLEATEETKGMRRRALKSRKARKSAQTPGRVETRQKVESMS